MNRASNPAMRASQAAITATTMAWASGLRSQVACGIFSGRSMSRRCSSQSCSAKHHGVNGYRARGRCLQVASISPAADSREELSRGRYDYWASHAARELFDGSIELKYARNRTLGCYGSCVSGRADLPQPS